MSHTLNCTVVIMCQAYIGKPLSHCHIIPLFVSRAKYLSHGFYLACRLGSTSKGENPVNNHKVKCFCGAAISVITLIGCRFLANFDL